MGLINDADNPTFRRLSAGLEVPSGDQQDRPSADAMWGAAFRTENVIGSFLAREDGIEDDQIDHDFNALSEDNLRGFEQYSNRFVDVFNERQNTALKRQISREQEDRKLLARSGWAGFGASMAAGTLDPTILIPVGGSIKKGESLLRIGQKMAYAGAAGATVSEALLHGSQETRTLEESGIAIAGGAVLGGLLGTGAVAGFRGATGKPVAGFDPDTLTKFEQEMIYDPDGDVNFAIDRADLDAMRDPQSVGAAAVAEPELADYELAGSLGTVTASNAIKLNPVIRTSVARSPAVREIGAQLMESGLFLNRNLEGKASPISVEQSMDAYRGWHAKSEEGARSAYKASRKDADHPNLTETQFYERVALAMRRGDQDASPHVMAAAKAYREALERTKSEAQKVGLLPDDVEVKTAQSYFHRIWNRKVLTHRPQDFQRMTSIWLGEAFDNLIAKANSLRFELDKAGAKPNAEDAKLLQQAEELEEIMRVEGGLDGLTRRASEDIYNTLTGQDQRLIDIGISITPNARGPLKERTFNIPDLFEADGLRVEDFLVNDAQEVMSRYMRVTAADIELTRSFGSPDMKDALERIQKDYAKLVGEAKTAKEKHSLHQEMRNRIKDLEGVRDIIRGQYGDANPDNKIRRTFALARTWNYVTLLGGMAVSALPDVGSKILTHGFLGIARDLVVPLARMKGIKGAAREAKEMGVAVEMVLRARMAAIADVGDTYSRASRFERFVDNTSNHFSKWSGMLLWNDTLKTADVITATNRAIRVMERPARAGKKSKAWLAQLGVGESDYKRIMTQYREHGSKEGGIRLANSDRWTDDEARRIWVGAMNKNANLNTVTPGAGDNYLWMNTEVGKTLTQFQSFFMAANQRIMIRGAQIGRMGDARFVSGLMTYLSLGALVYHLKLSVFAGRETSDDPETWAREAVDRSGMMPVFMHAVNTSEKMFGLNYLGSPSSRFASRERFGTIMGPTFGRGETIANLGRNIVDGELKDRDIHGIRKIMPYQNLFYMRWLLDEFEIAATDALDAEETSLSERRESRFSN